MRITLAGEGDPQRARHVRDLSSRVSRPIPLNALLRVTEELFPNSANAAAAIAAYRETVRRDPTNEARGRLRDVGQRP